MGEQDTPDDMAATPLDQRPFDFLGLPAELRDLCYDYMLCDTTDTKFDTEPFDVGELFSIDAGFHYRERGGRKLHIAVKYHHLQIGVLLSNHQIKQEYEKRAGLQPCTLQPLLECPDKNWVYNTVTQRTLRDGVCPTPALNFDVPTIKNIKLEFAVSDNGTWNQDQFLTFTAKWIQQFRGTLPLDCKVSIKIVAWTERPDDAEPRAYRFPVEFVKAIRDLETQIWGGREIAWCCVKQWLVTTRRGSADWTRLEKVGPDPRDEWLDDYDHPMWHTCKNCSRLDPDFVEEVAEINDGANAGQ